MPPEGCCPDCKGARRELRQQTGHLRAHRQGARLPARQGRGWVALTTLACGACGEPFTVDPMTRRLPSRCEACQAAARAADALQPIPASVRLLLADLELLSHGSTASWNPAGGPGNERAALPFGESDPPHLSLRVKYLEATTDERRRQVVKMMHEAIREFRGFGVDRSRVVGETTEQQDARICREGEGFSAQEVARRFNCTPTRVRRVRLADGRDVDLGRKPASAEAEANAETGDPAAEAARMRANGMTVRQIAFALGVPKSTVSDWLKAAA